ncbi:MAG: type II secretion system protein GspG [Planctomycetota bacterium]
MTADPFVRLFGIALTLLATACGQDAREDRSKGQDPQPGTGYVEPTDAPDRTPSDFARFVAEGDGGHFDTAVTTYRNDDGVTVRFFAAVHIADAAHYAELERRFAECGRLLYELVGPEDYRPKKGAERGSSLISMIQTGMKNGLELEFQLDGVDYSAANFVHADMTPEEFEDSMAERGENLFVMLFQVGMQAQKAMMEQAAAAEDDPSAAPVETFDLVKAFQNGEGRHVMRLTFAQQLESLEAASAGGDGSTLLEGRNEKCLTVLQREIAQGATDLGIYYGAAHLPHMERRLCEDLGFHKVGHEWLVAWDCTKRPDPKVDRELWRQRREAKRDLGRIGSAIEAWMAAHDGEVPTMAQLTGAADGAEAAWTGATADPWGNAYRVVGYERQPYFDVHCLGQDGEAGTDDDLHTSTPRDLRRMERGERRAGFLDRVRDQASAAQAEKAQSDCDSIRKSATFFRVKNGRWPAMADLTAKDERGSAYIDDLQPDPWGNAYVLRELENGRAEVRSAGPDGQLDTADDLTSR